MFFCCSRKFTNVPSYIFHHIITLCLLYFSWMMNAHRVGSLLILGNNNVIYFFLAIAKVTKILNKKKLAFASFWIFFVVRNIAKILFLRGTHISLFKTNLPYYPGFLLLNGFLLMLVVHNVYYTYILYKMAKTHYTFKSLKLKQNVD